MTGANASVLRFLKAKWMHFHFKIKIKVHSQNLNHYKIVLSFHFLPFNIMFPDVLCSIL